MQEEIVKKDIVNDKFKKGHNIEYRWKKIKRGVIIIFFVILGILIFVCLVLMPFIVDELYHCSPPTELFDVRLSKGDILDYYAQLFSLIATIILGIIAVVQTHNNQKKSEQINELQMSVAQRELAIVEKQFKDEIETKNAIVPKFEIKINGYSGNYSHIGIDIKNVSEMMISDFYIISFDILRGDEKEYSVNRWKMKFQSISSAETQHLEIFTPDMRIFDKDKPSVTYWENVKFIWKFSCYDCKGNKHFFSASIFIPNTNEVHVGEFWEVEKIG